MRLNSPQINLITRACMKASRSLIRDFGEIEKLQVSSKGPGDFVSSADKILSSFLALAIIGALPTNLQVTGPIMKAENMGKAVLITAGTVVGVILTVVSMNL